MACFIVPASEALVVSVAQVVLKRNPRTNSLQVTQKAGLLAHYLWGGSALLMVDHLLTGEVILQYPFFTAAPALIWHEMATTGVALAAAITLFWGVQWMIDLTLCRRRKAKEGTGPIPQNQ